MIHLNKLVLERVERMGLFDFLKKVVSGDSSQNKVGYTIPKSTDAYTYDIDPILTKKFSNGLLPGEIVLVDWVSGKNRNAQFPRYFETTYGLDAKRSLDKLIEEGYVKESSAIASLASLKLPELKEILKSKGLKVSGKKADLIERIGESSTEEEAEAYIDSRMLEATDKGNEVLAEYYYIVPAHRNDSKDGVYNVANAIRRVKELNYRPSNGDISFALFHKSYMEHAEKFQYGLMRNDIRHMAAQLEKEKKYQDSLFHYTRVYIMDLSGLCNSLRLEHPKTMMYDVPAKRQIKRLVEVLEYEEPELFDFFVLTWEKTVPGLKYHYLTFEECFHSLTCSLQDNDEQVKKWLFNGYNRLIKNTDEKSFLNEYGLFLPFD
jgi:SAP domain